MKNLFRFYFVAVLILGSLISYKDSSSQTGRMSNKFYLGPINVYFIDAMHKNPMFSWYNELNYNMMHNYSSHSDSASYDWPAGQLDGGFLESIGTYQNYINTSISNWNGYSASNSLIYQREKVERGGYGQRSTYQAEGDEQYWSNKFPRYGYKNANTIGRQKTDDALYGNNIVVKYCIVNVDDTGKVVSGLIENAEQVNFYSIIPPNANRSGARLYSDIKQPHYDFKWNIKPRMRVDSIYAKAHPFDTVAVIETKNYNGDVIKSEALLCRHFLKYYTGIPYYDGKYIEMFYNLSSPFTNTPSAFYVKADSLIEGRTANNDWRNSNVDFSIKWWGKVDMYIDYLRVDDDWAHYLFTDVNGDYSFYKFHQKIAEEVNAFGNNNGFGYLYIDEIFYNNIPCVAEVNRIIKSINPNTSMLIMNNVDRMFSEGGIKSNINDASRHAIMDTLFSSGAEKDIYLDFSYPYYYKYYYPPNVNTPNTDSVPASVVYNKARTPAQYNENSSLGIQRPIQNFLNTNKYARIKAKERNMDYAYSIQIHSDEAGININDPSHSWGLREPTDEEISTLCYTGLALGAKQILQYSYYSDLKRSNFNSWGLVYFDSISNWEYTKRFHNYYGQVKWNFVQTLNQKLKAMGDFIYPADNIPKHLVYDKTISVNNNEYSYDYINNIQSGIPNITGQDNYHSETGIGTVDNDLNRYWEIGFFKPNISNSENQYDKSKYFLAVNKRCTPISNGYSDERDLYIQLNSSQFQAFSNWKIINAVTKELVVPFPKNVTGYLNVGRFNPGEGKLLKIVPVMQEGGTFICNEEVLATNFYCDSTVFNNGYDLILYQGTKIMFNPKGKIVLNGGSFYSGYLPQGPIQMLTEFCGKNNSWEGISFQGCSYINISHSIFKNIAYEQPGGSPSSSIQNCAINMINCNNFNINSTKFYLDNKSGAIYYQFSDDSNPNWQNTYIGTNDFIINDGNSNSPLVLSFNSLSAIQMPLRIEGNYFNNIPGVSAMAIYINGISGGSVKNNTIHKFSEGLIALSSSLDLYNNTFYSNISSSKSVQGYNGSNINLSPSSQYYTGGSNRITTMNNESINLYTDNSFVFLDKGDNIFNVSPAGGGGNIPYHIYGTFPYSNEETYQATYNCFKIDSVNTDPVVDVTADGNPVSFNFDPYSCSTMLSGDFEVFTFAGLINDTIAVRNIGTGGSERGTGENISEIQISPCKSLADSININIRKRQYSIAEVQCKRMITLYSDSSKVFDALTKLYLASLSQDSAGI